MLMSPGGKPIISTRYFGSVSRYGDA